METGEVAVCDVAGNEVRDGQRGQRQAALPRIPAVVRRRVYGVADTTPIAVQSVLFDDPVGNARAHLQSGFALFEGTAPSHRYTAGTDRKTLQKGH